MTYFGLETIWESHPKFLTFIHPMYVLWKFNLQSSLDMSNNYSRRTNIRSRRMKCVSKAAAVTKTSLIIAIIKREESTQEG
jgi:hypothetical protein